MSKVTIVVSVYNEEAVLDKFYQAFEDRKASIPWDYELLFVNDGSQDESARILDRIAGGDDKVKVIHFSRNFGHEAAMIAGIDYATGDGIICMDADLQHPPELIPSIIQKFEEGYEVITMVRTANKSAGFFSNIASKMFYKLINFFSNDTSFDENASDFFAIGTKVAEVLRNNYREKNRFLRGYVQSVGYKKTSLTYEAHERAGGHSKYTFRKLLHFSVNTIVGFSDFPLKIGIYAGIFAALLGTIALIYTLCTFRTTAPSGYATIVILICFLFAMLFIVVGIIGEYISILFREMKDRPIYLVDKTKNLD
jgi:dolichol-phosphate mannosyltransferase